MSPLKEMCKSIAYRHLLEIYNTISKESAIEYIKNLSDRDLDFIEKYFHEDYIKIMNLCSEIKS